MDSFIRLADPDLTGRELEYVTECIRTGWLTWQGRFVNLFEEQFAAYVGMKHSIAVSNGTVAIHLALEALNIGAGDEVIAPSLSYVASASPIFHAGATPVLVDSDPDTWNMDINAVRQAITPRTKAIIAVHLYGNPCDMPALAQIAREHNLYLIEDAAESHGATINGQRVGSMSDIACFSFYANKIVTTGEGGICLTNDDHLAQRMALLRGQGMDRQRHYWHSVVGYNYRMTNLQAAIGVAQLERISEFQIKRQEISAIYTNLFAEQKSHIQLQQILANMEAVSWLYTVQIVGVNRAQRDRVIELLKQNDIETRPIFYPIHEFPPYESHREYPVAEKISASGISLPTHTQLKYPQIKRVVTALIESIEAVQYEELS
jgi:perosamine synthetase